MEIAFVLLAASAVFELISVYALLGFMRKVGALASISLVAVSAICLLFLYPSIETAGIVVISAYRIINLLRVIAGRLSEARLRTSSRVTTTWLLGCEAVALLLLWGVNGRYVSDRMLLWGLAIFQLCVALILFASTKRHLRTTKLRLGSTSFTNNDLPSITVAIPARNEDQQLEDCLRSVLASDYPKLEVLVLDDCSQDKTSQIIRGFAHDGVRFIPGENPKNNWLAKNQGYDQLMKESSGELLLFCGVDIRFDVSTIRNIVTSLLKKKKSMIGFMPLNPTARLSIPQSMRYMWELSLPRRMFNRPPVLSSCWLVRADALQRIGGFAAVSSSIVPEAYFARELIKTDGYSFLRSGKELGLTSIKSLFEQQETAIRTRYPQLHRRPELVGLLSIFEVLFLLGPLVVIVVGFFSGLSLGIWALVIGAMLVMLATYRDVLRAGFSEYRSRNIAAFPVTVVTDIVLLNYSMWQYEFSEVIWKGRNVCLPVMRTYPRLPKI